VSTAAAAAAVNCDNLPYACWLMDQCRRRCSKQWATPSTHWPNYATS